MENDHLESEMLATQDRVSESLNAPELSPIPASIVSPESLTAVEIQSCMEALLFLSDKPLSLSKLQGMVGPSLKMELFQEALLTLQERYQSSHHGIELVEVAGGHQFRTKLSRTPLAQKLAKVQTQRLSTGAMETLAIVAYKQPTMKEEIDKIRGVDSWYFIRGLLEKRLIQISGRSELPGRPILYSTTAEFLEIYGLKDLSALPSTRELEQMVPGSETDHPDEDPRAREIRKVVQTLSSSPNSSLAYDPQEDEKILKEIREKVASISTSTPYLDELKAAEILEKQQKALEIAPAQPSPTP